MKVTLTIEPVTGFDPALLKELLENNGCSVPGEGQQVFHADKPIAIVTCIKVEE
jgi:hypothetical protein